MAENTEAIAEDHAESTSPTRLWLLAATAFVGVFAVAGAVVLLGLWMTGRFGDRDAATDGGSIAEQDATKEPSDTEPTPVVASAAFRW